MGRRISKEFLHPSILEGVNDKIGNLDSLETDAKGNMVQAINELVDNLNRTSELEDELNEGKKLISDAIADDNINENSTFNDMSEAIKSKINNSQQLFFNGDKFGGQYFFIIKNDGSLWACGNNSYGQLGLGDSNNTKTTLSQVTTNINNGEVKQVACGDKFSLLLKNDGSLWGTGYNYLGQLGLGDGEQRNTFTQVTTNINNDVKYVTCSESWNYFSFIIKNDGSLWACGDNTYGQLGLGDTTQRNVFTQVTTNINNDVKDIGIFSESSNAYRSGVIVIKNDGTILFSGYCPLTDTVYSTFTII